VNEKEGARLTRTGLVVTPPPTDLGDGLAAEMAAAWARGERLPAEHFLERHPGLLDLPEATVRLIYEEVCLRQERGEAVTAEEMAQRFPRWASELAAMLDCHRLVQAHLGPPQFPAAGESLGDFRLLAELGRGTHGRVFLASQPALADRPVVLKVTPRQDREFLSLARLQHTHIIPLYGVHDFPARNLRALCQPYFGGATLARLLDLMRPVPAARRTGRTLVEALDGAPGWLASGGRQSPGDWNRGTDVPRSPNAGGNVDGLPIRPTRGPREALARMGYAEAVCWVGACLAEALQYAHERGVVHLDLKPSNVLLAADGQPLLLDFHLALHPVPAGRVAPEGMGGTPEYMSPEQRAAYVAARRGQPVPAAVDRRSDVYSLGRLLYTALGGKASGDGETPPPLRRCNPWVSVGLADVVHRCLAPDPAGRYPDAAALAADLRRHLADLPLRGVPNRSLRERWRKWRRRRPYSLLWPSLLLTLAAAAVTLGAAGLERLRDAREALREGQEQMRRHSHAEAARTLARGKERAETVPGCRDLVGQFDAWLRRAGRARAADQLHAVTERLRFLAGGDGLPAADLRTLEAHCRTAWEVRDLVAGRPAAPLDDDTEEQARADLIDLALLWADLKQQLAPGDEAARAEARALLAEAEALAGPSPALARELRALGGSAAPAGDAAAPTFREHLALGRALFRAGELDRAARELGRAVELRPQDFWAHFYRGACAYRRGQHADAVASFTAAVALAPDCPEAYHNRALAAAACGKTAAALHDYGRALELAPTLASAALNRGILHYQQGSYPEALADLGSALRLGADPAAVHYNLALVHLAQGERTAAGESVARALQHTPTHAQARQLRDRLRGDQ
jgi:serine/threonine protein kinase/Flp pilus assembly protein TadD